ncbi:MAG: helix-turn-helix domain-containing protein [Arenimonas sp.]
MPKTIHRPEYDVLRSLLRQARLEAGVLQKDLSAALGHQQSFVSDVERGVRRIDIIELRDFCLAFGIDFHEFVAILETEIHQNKSKLKKLTAIKSIGNTRKTKPSK